MKTNYERTEEFKYSFTIYLEGVDKHTVSYLDLDGAKEFKKKLEINNEVFNVDECDENGYLTEVNL